MVAYLNSDGRLSGGASALRYKQDIEESTFPLDAILGVKTYTYRLKAAVAELGDDATVEVGVIAEQLIEAGLSEFVAMDADGRAQSVNYERLVGPLIGAAQALAARLEALEARA